VPEPRRRDQRIGVRRHADDGHSTRLRDGLDGRRDPPNGFAFEELSICSAENLRSEGEGVPSPEGTERSLANAHAPARIALRCLPLCRVAAEMPEARVRISLEIPYGRVYEPYAIDVQGRSLDRVNPCSS
jgi:hypothetical protein